MILDIDQIKILIPHRSPFLLLDECEIISSGIVLTGGAASMQGMAELAEDVFQSPVRVGIPMGLGGLIDVVNNPMYATCTGLIQYGSKRVKTGPIRELQGRNLFDKIFSRMKDWADEFF